MTDRKQDLGKTIDESARTVHSEGDEANNGTVAGSGTDAPSELAARFTRGATFGHFLVIDQLGAGAMGVVVSAYDTALDRKVAIKVLAPQRSGEMSRTRLVREAQAMARLAHPNVVAVYEVLELGREVAVVMELVDGRTLTRWLKEHERPWQDVLDAFVRAGRGLAAAHDAGLVHRDFKPDNVLVARDGRVRVTDFGLAAQVSLTGDESAEPPVTPSSSALDVALTQTGALMGTPSYMSPEQFLQEAIAPPSDQFSFCLAVWEALYGGRPFAGESVVQIATNVVMGRLQPPPPGSNVPAWIHRVLTRGLQNKPEDRFPSMHPLLAELTRKPTARPSDPADAQRVDELTDRLAQAELLYQEGRYDEALAIANEVTREAELVGYDPLRAASLLVEAQSHMQLTEIDRAEALLQETIRCATESGQDAIAARAWTVLPSVIGGMQGRLEEGMAWVRAAELAVTRAGGQPALRMALHRSMARVLGQRGDHDGSRHHNEQALELAEGGGSEMQVHIPVLLNNIGAGYEVEGRYVEALKMFRRALADAERLRGPGHTSCAMFANNAAMILLRQGHYDEALAFIERARNIRENAFGPDSPLLATVLHMLGLALLSRGQAQEALEPVDRALTIRRQALQPGDRSLFYSLAARADCLLALDRFPEAVATLQEGEALLAHVPELRQYVGGWLDIVQARLARRQGNPAGAVTLLERAIERLAARFGSQHPKLTEARAELGSTLLDLGQSGRAEPLLQQALEAMEQLDALPALTEPIQRELARARGTQVIRIDALRSAPEAAPLVDHAITILAVSDLERAVSFYRNAFGWPERERAPVYVELALPGGRGLGLFARGSFERVTGKPPAPAPAPDSGTTATELYLRCQRPQRIIDRLHDIGAELLSPLAPRDWGDEAAYFRDLDGNVLVIARKLGTDGE